MRAYNFSAGPAMLPDAVMQQAREEMLDWRGSGMSVMEMSHRGPEYTEIAQQAEADLRELMGISDDYAVLFLQGGASSQFSMIPMNLLRGAHRADYANTGAWSEKAINEARRYCEVNVVADAKPSHYTTIPDFADWQVSDDAAYLHYTPNETIHGVEFHDIPTMGKAPLIADMSSTILSRPVDVNRFGMIYAGAQKNIGPAGLCIVIIRRDLMGKTLPGTPTMFDYQIHADNASMYNTPATYSWYLAGLVFQWLKQQGGLSAMAEINGRKATKLYAAIDGSDFYANPVDPRYRSWMNIPFTLADSSLDKQFLQMAATQGLLTLKGHRDLGGMRASIYNAMPEEGVDKLIAFMAEFERRFG
ncbi:3-phosphoserine/phosphohydroxythreonine transaminase [Methylophaga sp. OBS3]|uniref:3-phosphoserine/phosphohydroxythreonine transaminase n=1 Tax=Methylophaga sp. OBS3 TaxID=2991934 RepID=UPI0022506A5E|nr:3-phosphoserine/phosphohydroxythreonine transaminase [Methylophaga sp. OBS3]MCX4189338.1 3-phosphoserine/phosphohydroxythreonine transaminase [Methylophaga sp. OBS3]